MPLSYSLEVKETAEQFWVQSPQAKKQLKKPQKARENSAFCQFWYIKVCYDSQQQYILKIQPYSF